MANYIDKNGADISDIENIELPPEAFGKCDEDEITLIPLMYQAGYLTIKDYNEFMLKRASTMNKLFSALHSGDADAFMEMIKVYMQSIKFDLITKMTEYYFEFAFANILNMLGFNCEIEVHSATTYM